MITIQHSRFKTNNMKNNKGFSLIEVLLAAFILSFISLAIFKTLDVSILSSNLSNSLVSDADLKIAIHNVLKPDQCERNLNPDNLNNISPTSKTIDSLKKYNDPTNPSDTSGVELIKINERFRDYLDIVKIELAGPDTDTQREFKVYYKRNRVKHLSTRDKKPCDSTNQSGCYVNKCNVEYEVTGGTDVTTCTVLDCFSIGSSTVNNVLNGCYSVENDSLIFSCGDKSHIGGVGTVVLGNNILRNGSVTGNYNSFLGYQSGRRATVTGRRNSFLGSETGSSAIVSGWRNSFLSYASGSASEVTGHDNIFVGYNTGYKNKTGGDGNTFIGAYAGARNEIIVPGGFNTFIGFKAGYKSTVNTAYTLNLGNAIIMKSSNTGPDADNLLDDSAYNVPVGEVRINGALKLCNERGLSSSCKPVAKQSDIDSLKATVEALKNKIDAICNHANKPDGCPP